MFTLAEIMNKLPIFQRGMSSNHRHRGSRYNKYRKSLKGPIENKDHSKIRTIRSTGEKENKDRSLLSVIYGNTSFWPENPIQKPPAMYQAKYANL